MLRGQVDSLVAKKPQVIGLGLGPSTPKDMQGVHSGLEPLEQAGLLDQSD